MLLYNISGQQMGKINTMERKPEYFSNHLATSQIRYESKVTLVDLSKVPYCIEQWYKDLESFLEVHWSDMIISLAAMPSENTHEAMKVRIFYVTANLSFELDLKTNA